MEANEYVNGNRLRSGAVYRETEDGELLQTKLYSIPETKVNGFEHFTTINLGFLTQMRINAGNYNKRLEEKRMEIKNNNELSEKQRKSEMARISEMKMSGLDYEVFFFLIETMDFKNAVTVSQQNIAEILGKRKEVVSRSMKRLEGFGVIQVVGKEGRHKKVLLNPDVVWRGKSNQHRMAQEGLLPGFEYRE